MYLKLSKVNESIISRGRFYDRFLLKKSKLIIQHKIIGSSSSSFGKVKLVKYEKENRFMYSPLTIDSSSSRVNEIFIPSNKLFSLSIEIYEGPTEEFNDIFKINADYGSTILIELMFAPTKSWILKAFKNKYELNVDELVKNLDLDKETIIEGIKAHRIYPNNLTENAKADKEIILEFIKISGHLIAEASQELQLNREVVDAALTQDGGAFSSLHSSWRNQKEILMAALKSGSSRNTPSILNKVDKKLLSDRDVALAVAKNLGDDIQYLDSRFRKDKEIVLEAVKEYGYSYAYADISLKQDKDIILAAIMQRPHGFDNQGGPLKYIVKHIKDPKTLQDYVKIAAMYNPSAIKFAEDKLKNDRKFILMVSRKTGGAIPYVDPSFSKDLEIVLTSVKSNGGAIVHADKSFRCNEEIAFHAVKNRVEVFEVLDDDLKDNRKFILDLSKSVIGVLKYVNEKFRDDDEIANMAMNISPRYAYPYLSSRLKQNKQYIKLYENDTKAK